ncbi:MAG: Glutathione S-transferase, unnamed subgroup, partial [uncultured Solirubrobacteraceae bacterium]
AAVQLARLGQLLQGPPAPGAPRSRLRRPRARRRRPHRSAGSPRRTESGAADPDARPRRRPSHRGVQRDPDVLRRGHALPPRGPLRARAGPPVAVLRAVQPRAVSRGRPLLGRLRRASPASGGGRGAPRRGLPDAGRARAPPRSAPLPGRRALHGRRHRAVRLHPRRSRGRLRPRALSRHQPLARAGGRRGRPRADDAGARL